MAGSDFREIDYNQSVAEILKPYADDGDVNKDLRFIMQCFFGAEEPNPKYPYMFWADTANGYLKQRNGTNDAWEIREILGEDSFLRSGLYPMSGNLDLGNYKIQNLLGTLHKAATELTIAGGAFTVTQMLHTIDTEADAASDELDTINGGTTIDMIILRAENDARTVVLKHNTGNIWNPAQIDISLDDIRDACMLWWDGTKWIVLSVWIELAEQQVLGRLTGGVKKGLTVAEQQTLILSAAFPEQTSLLMPASLSADGKYMIKDGIAGTLGETVAFGELAYFKASDSKWYKAKADVTATSGAVAVGFCCIAGAANAATVIMFRGLIRADALFDTFTISAPIFISATTAGKVVSARPSGTANFVNRIVGHSLDGDTIIANVSPDYIELSS